MKRTRGFTLIELLVVISIIALLIALLLPALGAARSVAMDLKCMTRLQQVSRSMMLYADDYKGFFPRTIAQNNWQYHWSSHQSLGQYMGGLEPGPNEYPFWAAKDPASPVSCTKRRPPVGSKYDTWGVGDTKDGASYMLNRFFSEPGWGPLYAGKKGGSINMVPQPARLIIAGDSTELWLGSADRMYPLDHLNSTAAAAGSYRPAPGYRHGGPMRDTTYTNRTTTGHYMWQVTPGATNTPQPVDILYSMANMAFGDGHARPINHMEGLYGNATLNSLWVWENGMW